MGIVRGLEPIPARCWARPESPSLGALGGQLSILVSTARRSAGNQASARLAVGAGLLSGVEVGGHGGWGKGGAVDGDVGDAAGEEITAALQHAGP